MYRPIGSNRGNETSKYILKAKTEQEMLRWVDAMTQVTSGQVRNNPQ